MLNALIKYFYYHGQALQYILEDGFKHCAKIDKIICEIIFKYIQYLYLLKKI